MGKTSEEVKQQIFLTAIEAFSPAHVKVLNVFRGGKIPWDQHSTILANRNYGAAIQVMVPELKGQDSLTLAVLNELRSRGFSNLSRLDEPFPGMHITNIGIEFLNFVLSPMVS